jgi:hypothetical protein
VHMMIYDFISSIARGGLAFMSTDEPTKHELHGQETLIYACQLHSFQNAKIIGFSM